MPAGCNEEQPSPRTNSSMQLQPATPCTSSQQPQPEHHAVNISITSRGEANPGPESDEMATDLTRDTNSVGQTTEIISPTHSPTDPFLDPQTHHHLSPH